MAGTAVCKDLNWAPTVHGRGEMLSGRRWVKREERKLREASSGSALAESGTA